LGSIIRKPFFQFQNQAITIYDPPHILKWTRNLFLKYGVEFESECLDSQLSVIDKWEHTDKLFKHDKHVMICVLYKLTDTHLSHYLLCHESEPGCSSHETHSVSRNLHSGVLW
jgi:hypothetical protein